jgi:hypothetical protein
MVSPSPPHILPETNMPAKSKAQLKAMHAAASGHSTLGIPKKVGKEYVKAQHGKSVKSLPKRKGKKGKRGG